MTEIDQESDVTHLTLGDVAAALRVSRGTVYRLIGDGDLRSIQVGRLRRVPLAALREYLAEQSRREAARIEGGAA